MSYPSKCYDCGGQIVPVPVTKNISVPTCKGCGEEYTDEETDLALEAKSWIEEQLERPAIRKAYKEVVLEEIRETEGDDNMDKEFKDSHLEFLKNLLLTLETK